MHPGQAGVLLLEIPQLEDFGTFAESDLHKNELEALAAYFALKAYCKILNNMSIHINVDNTSVVSTLNKKASQNTFIFNTVKKTWFSV